MNIELLKPSLACLPAYTVALEQGWSPVNVREAEVAQEELEKIRANPSDFLEMMDDPHAKGGPVTLPDGSTAQRIPSFRRWIWDGEFCGSIGFRWQPGTPLLPPHVLGHIGYAVVPWKRNKGYATTALGLLLKEINKRIPYVEITTDPDNIASQRVVVANGGVLVERFRKLAAYGEKEALRFRIYL